MLLALHTPAGRLHQGLERLRARLARDWRTIRVVLGLWITALVPGTARAFDVNPDPDRIDQTIAFRERLKDYDSIKLFGAERVSDRTRNAYQPDGIRVGNLLIFPSIATATTYDDNIHGSAGPRIADMRFDVAPSIRVRSSSVHARADRALRPGRADRHAAIAVRH